jgi:alkanesulfonate monooxygenase SsuD/methylene tetrahydromethanopterin reductase-like flavin-dependent oxidoreductase (luciferase family)
MKLGFFTMPMHPIGKDWQQSLREDREAFILADQLGFVEGYCGEHATDPEENITSSALFMATLIDATQRIKLGTGTLNMPNHHPAAVAGAIAMLLADVSSSGLAPVPCLRIPSFMATWT